MKLSSSEIFEEIYAWRRDPKSSFSDWTIRVIQDSDENSYGLTSNRNDDDCVEEKNCIGSNVKLETVYSDDDSTSNRRNNDCEEERNCSGSSGSSGKLESVYHVHRVYLASGRRKSGYFKNLFSLATSTEDSISSTTKLVLPESACKVFPQFLDYIYGGGLEVGPFLDLHCSRAKLGNSDACRNEVALVFLAVFLQVPSLYSLTKDRINCILDDCNVHIICRETMLYKLDWIINMCINVAARSPRDLIPPPISSKETGAISDPYFSTSTLQSRSDADKTSLRIFPPALQTMKMLPVEKQTELWQLSLANSMLELGRFKRVPSGWEDKIDDAVATQMPALLNNSTNDWIFPRQGCGLRLDDSKMCPLFYFDQPLSIVPSSEISPDTLVWQQQVTPTNRRDLSRRRGGSRSTSTSPSTSTTPTSSCRRDRSRRTGGSPRTSTSTSTSPNTSTSTSYGRK